MSIFNMFKKKKETSKEIDSEKIRQMENSRTEEISENHKAHELYTLNPRIDIKKKTPMYDLWQIYQSASDGDDIFRPLEYIEQTIIKEKEKAAVSENPDRLNKNESELLKFIQIIQKHCENIILRMKNERLAAERNHKESSGKTEVVYTPVNAEPLLYMTKDKVRLWAVIIPPLNGGKHITTEIVNLKMSLLTIKYGINREIINKIVSGKLYLQIFEIAVGKPAVNGKNGSVENLFSKARNKINIKEDTNGNVNYKELNMIQSIHKGEPICNVTLPTPAIDGMTVTGEVIKGIDGKFPAVPAGKNTVLSENQTQLVAGIDGEVVFEDNKFHVKNLLTINHDVDNSIGNINFAGDVLIKGDVREGYTVKADGDVKIIGTVEGATVITGGDLVIERGMTGGNKGVIESQGSLKCRYLENCRVYAKGGIEADQIMYSTLSTDENIVVRGKKGSVTGGKLIAGRSIEAVTIGSLANNHLKTEIVLGAVPQLIEQEKELQAQLDSTENTLHRLNQDINYIENNIEKANEERKEMLKNMKFEYQISEMQQIKLNENLEEIRQKIKSNTEMCSLRCENIYPIINLNVCGSTYTLDMDLKDCKVARKNDTTYIMSPMLDNIISF